MQNKPQKKNVLDFLPKGPSFAEHQEVLEKRKIEQKKLEELAGTAPDKEG